MESTESDKAHKHWLATGFSGELRKNEGRRKQDVNVCTACVLSRSLLVHSCKCAGSAGSAAAAGTGTAHHYE